MIRSMTGYSRCRREEADFSLAVGVKSTNHRFLDLQMRLPAEIEPLESLVRRLVKDRVGRGHIEITITLERSDSHQLTIDRKLMDAYAAACHHLKSQYGFSSQPDPMTLLRIPGMLSGGNDALGGEELGRVSKLLEVLTQETLAQLNDMRAREGEALERDLQGRVGRLRELAKDVEELSIQAAPIYQRRLETRLRDLLGAVNIDSGRLAQEVAYLATHSDVTEELTRFRSHLDQVSHLLSESQEVGKKLDFLLQEMNREANTLLSKTTDVPEVGLAIGRQAIEMKTEIEKLREQAQNIE